MVLTGRRPTVYDLAMCREVELYRAAGHAITDVMKKFRISRHTMYSMITRAKEAKQVETPQIEKAFPSPSGNMVLPEGSGGKWSCLFFSRNRHFAGGCEFILRPDWHDMMAAAQFFGLKCSDFWDKEVDGRKTKGEIFPETGNCVPCGYFELTRKTEDEPSIEELIR